MRVDQGSGDVLVLAGDINCGAAGIERYGRLAARLPGTEILYVPGNHEFYGLEWNQTMRELREAARKFGVILLDRESIVVDGVRFLGATLWTDFNALGESRRAAAMEKARNYINDYKMISLGMTAPKPLDTLRWHELSRKWLEPELAKNFDSPTVVVTHHGPSPKCHDYDRYGDPDLYTPSFWSDLEYLMKPERVGLWIYGHTHTNKRFEVNGVRVVTNQRGYPGELGPASGFDRNHTIEA